MRSSGSLRISSAIFFTALATVAPASRGQTFQGLGNRPEYSQPVKSVGLSGDGSLVLGSVSTAGVVHLWTQSTGWTTLARPGTTILATDANFDGSVVVGTARLGLSTQSGFRWSSQSGFTDFGGTPGYALSYATAVSDDGNTVSGRLKVSEFIDGYRAFRWTQSSGLVNLGVIGSGTYADGNGISNDGLFVVGISGSLIARWSDPSLGDLLGSGTAMASNSDGSVLVGYRGQEAFRWTAETGVTGLGFVPNFQKTLARQVSSDGSVVIGVASNVFGSASAAFYWSQATGAVDLNTYLPSLGIDLTGWTLQTAVGLSNDGLVITGNGLHNGIQESWIARLPPNTRCGSSDFNSDGDFGTDADIEAFFACLAGNCCPACGTSDFNADGDFGTDADIESFFRVLAGGIC